MTKYRPMSALAQPNARPLRTDFSVVETGMLSRIGEKLKKKGEKAFKWAKKKAEKAGRVLGAAVAAGKEEAKKERLYTGDTNKLAF